MTRKFILGAYVHTLKIYSHQNNTVKHRDIILWPYMSMDEYHDIRVAPGDTDYIGDTDYMKAKFMVWGDANGVLLTLEEDYLNES